MASSVSDGTLHLWRSKTIDAFARAEAIIDVLLKKLNVPTKADMLSAKIEALRKAKHNAVVIEDRKTKIDQLLVELCKVLPLRNDIVHSPMIVEKVGEDISATFANPNLQCSFSSYKRVITGPRLQALATKVDQVAKTLESC